MSERQGPCLYITNLPRSWNRGLWKWFYRLNRVHLRELEKAEIDKMLFGTGFMHYPNGGDPKRLDPRDVYIDLH